MEDVSIIGRDLTKTFVQQHSRLSMRGPIFFAALSGWNGVRCNWCSDQGDGAGAATTILLQKSVPVWCPTGGAYAASRAIAAHSARCLHLRLVKRSIWQDTKTWIAFARNT
jgi:hypothetical protein